MPLWSVYEPPGAEPLSREAAERAAFVRDRWSWGALFLAPIWLLWRRMWLVFLGWLAVMVLIRLAGSMLHAPAGALWAFALVFSAWFALEAPMLRMWTLDRRGWRLAGVAAGSSRTEAEQRYFAEREPRPDGDAGAEPARRPAAPASPTALTPLRRGPDEGVIGLFPEPWDGKR